MGEFLIITCVFVCVYTVYIFQVVTESFLLTPFRECAWVCLCVCVRMCEQQLFLHIKFLLTDPFPPHQDMYSFTIKYKCLHLL